MTARSTVLARITFCALLAACGAAAVFKTDASAHESDCHAQQTCPSDDGGYVWTDANGQGWICALRSGRLDGTVIIFDGQQYTCEAVMPDPQPPPTEPPPAPAEPPPPPSSETGAPAPAPVPPKPSSTPSAKTREPKARATKRERGAQWNSRPQPRVEESEPVAPSPPVWGFGPPSAAEPVLLGGPYVFPVFGPAAFVDTFGAPRTTVSWHHGDDIFAPAGAPILAVAAGTIFSVGWNDLGGNRLWLRDRQGNEFYYAHLSAFSPLAAEGARVAAGEVLGYVGRTGDAEGTPTHLHFEIHPVSMLGLGYDGAVNPTGYLESWRRVTELSDASGAGVASRPGAILLAVSDISTASGLEDGSLQRALNGQEAGETAHSVAQLQLGHRRWTEAERSAADAELKGESDRIRARVVAPLRPSSVGRARRLRGRRRLAR